MKSPASRSTRRSATRSCKGSTRLSAGTAQKMILNMISTGVMVRLGRTYANLMIGVRAANAKLRARARDIVRAVTGASDGVEAALETAGRRRRARVPDDRARSRPGRGGAPP